MKNKRYYLALGALFLLLSCEKYQDDKIGVEGRFRLFLAGTAGIVSDSAATLELVVEKSIATDRDLSVEFLPSPGHMVFSRVSFSGDRATGTLKVGQESGLYRLDISVRDGDKLVWKKDTVFRLEPALPQTLRIEGDKSRYLVAPGSKVVLKTFLGRTLGKVSPGRSVEFRAFQLNGPADTSFVGNFLDVANNLSAMDQSLKPVSLMTDAADIDTLRNLYIQARTKGDGQLLRSQLVLQYQKKP